MGESGVLWVIVGESTVRFRGEYNCTVDDKGRVNMPAKIRKALSPEAEETFVVVRGPDSCLRAYPQDEWSRKEDEIYNRPETQDTVKFKRMIAGSLHDTTLDAQGRINLSSKLLALAQITKNVVVAGNKGYVEIWDSEKYRAYMENFQNFDELFFNSIDLTNKALG